MSLSISRMENICVTKQVWAYISSDFFLIESFNLKLTYLIDSPIGTYIRYEFIHFSKKNYFCRSYLKLLFIAKNIIIRRAFVNINPFASIRYTHYLECNFQVKFKIKSFFNRKSNYFFSCSISFIARTIQKDTFYRLIESNFLIWLLYVLNPCWKKNNSKRKVVLFIIENRKHSSLEK